MSQNFVFNASFFELLIKIDTELAKEVLAKGCPYCGSRLHQSNYPRSPFGLSQPFRSYCNERNSFCCSNCRKRTTPSSVRFFGRRRFVALIFVLMSVLTLGMNERRLRQVKRHLNITVSESTWKRWRSWWRNSFQSTKFWLQEKGIVKPSLQESVWLPRTLYRLFKGTLIEKIPKLLRFLSPLTGGDLRAV